LFNPDVVDHNPIKDRVGYNNACVGWDTAPASYFATYVLVLAAYHSVLKINKKCGPDSPVPGGHKNILINYFYLRIII
jgi:hypothetical protein